MAKVKAKSFLQSKTFWFAVLKAVAGIVAMILSPEEAVDVAGGLSVVVAGVDIFIRKLTSSPVSFK